jgi:hypothetical protein
MKKSYIENIRKYVKDKGYVPTSDIIKEAINTVCPDGGNILENKTAIINEVIRLMTIGQRSETSQKSELTTHAQGIVHCQKSELTNDVQPIIHSQESELSHQDESTNLDSNTLTEAPTDLNLIERGEVENQLIESEEEAETGIVVSGGETGRTHLNFKPGVALPHPRLETQVFQRLRYYSIRLRFSL